MLVNDTLFDDHMLRFRCQRYARLGWTIAQQSADGRIVILRRKTRSWLSPNFLRTLLNVTWVGKDEYMMLSFDARRQLHVRPYHP